MKSGFTGFSPSVAAFLELVLASIFWGFGFIATIWAIEDLNSNAVIFYRFLIAFVFGGIFLFKIDKKILLTEFKTSVITGFLLSLTLYLQTLGLRTTSATKSAFLTSTYVLMVPILAHFFIKEKIKNLHFVWVGLALFGILLLTGSQLTEWSLGDFLTLLCALVASIHIVAIGYFAKKSINSFAYNVFQSFWAMNFSLLFQFEKGSWDLFNIKPLGWVGLFSLGICSTLIGFFLQIRAQKVLSSAVSSILFLMEAPWTILLSFFILSEIPTLNQMLGAALIIFASFCSIVFRNGFQVKSLFPNRSN